MFFSSERVDEIVCHLFIKSARPFVLSHSGFSMCNKQMVFQLQCNCSAWRRSNAHINSEYLINVCYSTLSQNVTHGSLCERDLLAHFSTATSLHRSIQKIG